MKLEVGLPAAVEWRHECGVDVRVGEAERVAELVGGRLQEVGAFEGVDRPILLHFGRRSKKWVSVGPGRAFQILQ